MKAHFLLPLFVSAVAGSAVAQEIDHDSEAYEYAAPVSDAEDGGVKEKSDPAGAASVGPALKGASRTIPMRRVQAEFVSSPAIQSPTSLDSNAAVQRLNVGEAPTPSTAHLLHSVPPVSHAYPLPRDALLVAFDRVAWIGECRSRLETYDDSVRHKVISALAGSDTSQPGDGRNDASALCEAYLDDYVAKAGKSAAGAHYTQSGQYMLVPVTVAVQQRAVYRDQPIAD